MAVWRKKLRNKKTGQYHRSDTWWISWREATGKRVQRSTAFGPREKWKAKRLQCEKQAEACKATQSQQAANALTKVAAPTLTLADLRSSFLDWLKVRRRPTTVDFYRYRLASIVTWLADQAPPVLVADQLTPELIERFVDAQKGNSSDATINHSIKALRTTLGWAVRQRRGLDANPLANVVTITVAPARPRRTPLTQVEFNRLLESTPRWRRPLWLFFVLTGCRKREVTELQFSDYQNQSVTIPAAISKNGTARTVPLPASLVQLLEEHVRPELRTRQRRMNTALDRAEVRLAKLADGQPRDRQIVLIERMQNDLQHSRLFTNRDGFPLRNNLLRLLKADAKKAGIRAIDVHSLRYTYDAWSLGLGINPKVVQARMGHKRAEMTINLYAPNSFFTSRDGLDDLAGLAGLGTPPSGHGGPQTQPCDPVTLPESEVPRPTRELLIALAPKFSDRSLASIFGLSPRGIGKAMVRFGVKRSARVINRTMTTAEITAARASIYTTAASAEPEEFTRFGATFG